MMKISTDPTQKSMVSSATSPLLNHTTKNEPSNESTVTMVVDIFRVTPVASSMNAFAGCSIESELVIAARNNMKNQTDPKKFPKGMCAKTTGSVLNPRLKEDPVTVLVNPMPRKTTAAGIVIRPPRATSKNSFVADAVNPDSTTSSLRLTYFASLMMMP